jgi:hypothetical protein
MMSATLGRVEAIRHGAFALVRWLDSGWTSEVPLVRLKRMESRMTSMRTTTV